MFRRFYHAVINRVLNPLENRFIKSSLNKPTLLLKPRLPNGIFITTTEISR